MIKHRALAEQPLKSPDLNFAEPLEGSQRGDRHSDIP
jgi:hypothetical protein